MNAYDFAYIVGLTAASPLWLTIPSARRKVRRALQLRMGNLALGATPDISDNAPPRIMIHAVSLGEINATRALVALLRSARPGLRFIISVTTDTGFDRGLELYGAAPDVTLIRYPLDFSSAVTRVLDNLRPSIVALMELEVWPNFISYCRQRDIPVVLINGRLTTSSYKRYRWTKPLVRGMFQSLDRICAQERAYADRFIALGADPAKVEVTGTMKFDTAAVQSGIPGDALLAVQVGLRPGKESILVCGSTGPGEEEFLLQIYRRLLARFSRLRLVLVPRKPERFDEVAELIVASRFDLIRRSNGQIPPPGALPPVILGDTMGELRKFYSLADLVFVGRSLVDLGPRQHGSDMIEPAALAKPTMVGPYTGNFAEPMRAFTLADAMLTVADAEALEQAVGVLLSSPNEARAMGDRAQMVVRLNQGATTKHARVILETLAARAAASAV